MRDLLSIGTNRRESMIGTGIGLGLSGFRVNPPGVLPVLDLDFANLKTLTASKGPTPSFSRASSGTYFDASGVLHTAAINAPRFNHTFNGTSWVSKGLLVEEQRTNFLNYSQDYSNAYWTKWQINPSYNTGETSAPDGSNTATKGTSTIASECSIYRNFGTVSAGTYTLSAFFKAGTASIAGLEIYENGSNRFAASFTLTGSASTATIINLGFSNCSSSIANVGNGWYRCSITISRSTTGTISTYNYLSLNSTTAVTTTVGTTCYLWGTQLEAGSFATSYIPTTSSSVTRSADVCQITGTDFSSFWNGTEGSFAVEFDNNTIDFGTKTTRVLTAWNSGKTQGIALDNRASSTTVEINPSATFVYSPPVLLNKIAFAYKVNDFACSRNGDNVLTDISGAAPTGVIQLNIGNNDAGSIFHNGHIARLRYYPVRLTNAKLQELST